MAEAAGFETGSDRRGRPPPGSARPGPARACGPGRGRGRRRGAGSVALLRFDHAYFLHGREADSRLPRRGGRCRRRSALAPKLLSRRFFVVGSRRGPRAAVEAGPALLRAPGSVPFTAAHAALSYGLVRLGRLVDAIELLSPILGTKTMPTATDPDLWEPFPTVVAIYALVYAGHLGEAEELLTRAWLLVVTARRRNQKLRRRLARRPAPRTRPRESAFAGLPSLIPLSAARSPRLPMALWRRRAGTGAHRAGRPGGRDARGDGCLGLPTNLLNETDLLQARAWAAAAAGDLPGARDHLEAAPTSAKRSVT